LSEKFVWADDVRREIQQKADSLEKAVQQMDGKWLFGRLAEKHQGIPWDWLREHVHQPDFSEPELVVQAWCNGSLSRTAAEKVQKEIERNEELRNIYKSRLEREVARIKVNTYHPVIHPYPLLSCRLPHLGEEAFLQILPSEKGVEFRWPGKDPLLLPEGTHHLDIKDSFIERLDLEVSGAQFQTEAKLLLDQLQSINEENKKVEPKVTRTLISEFQRLIQPESEWFKKLQAIIPCLDRGEDSTEEQEYLALLAIACRVELEKIMLRHLDFEAMAMLRDLDFSLEPIARATIIVDREQYDELLGDMPLVNTWWTYAKMLNQAIPDEVLEQTLEEYAKKKKENQPATGKSILEILKNFLRLPVPNLSPVVGAVCAANPSALFNYFGGMRIIPLGRTEDGTELVAVKNKLRLRPSEKASDYKYKIEFVTPSGKKTVEGMPVEDFIEFSLEPEFSGISAIEILSPDGQLIERFENDEKPGT
ncbi:MAG: hypothetical protein ONB05_08410, partial [candidate division KSB1 bacterium]|nr:hypothetical protein [candidate division KSB1 bacterium]